ncbi:MAG: flagellin [Spirochaetota bacterium]|nr:flagellin [Spirochaetota bacterium]
MVINHNIAAIFSHRQLKTNNLNLDRSVEKLSSGMKINRAGDDASGLAVSEKMRSQIRGLKRAALNAEDDISFIQTTEGYLQNTQNVLQRMRELAIQAANGIYSNEDRIMIQVEVSQLVDEVDRIASHAQFNEMNLLTGRFAQSTTTSVAAASMWFHIGANMDQREQVYIGTMTATALKMKSLADAKDILSLSTPDKANRALATIDEALMKVTKQRADLGAYQTRLEFAVQGLMVGYENLQAAESRIRDTDMAEETIRLTKSQVLLQASNAMLAQANVKPKLVLQLLS